MDQICNENGFTTETYTVTTEDDYILSLWRIPGTIEDPDATNKPAVLMVHC